MARKLVADDGAYVFQFFKPDKLERRFTPLLWGDPVEVVEQRPEGIKVRFDDRDGWLPRDVTLADDVPILRIAFVDVGQGDGAVIVTPTGKRIVVDGGPSFNLAHYVHKIFGWPAEPRIDLDALVITHGDADHFEGLNELFFREINPQPNPEGAFTGVHCARLYQNGLAKGRGRTETAFGRSRVVPGPQGNETYLLDLEDDLTTVPTPRLNDPFLRWQATLEDLRSDHPAAFPTTRQALHSGSQDSFAWAAGPGFAIEVLGPVRATLADGAPALRFRTDAGQTINGHSVILRIRIGNTRILLGGDLNRAFEDDLVAHYAAANQLDRLQAEVLKVPHHGSHDLSAAFLKAVNPIVSVISSGDETTTGSDHIHPRAVLLGALGRASRTDLPLIFCTELSAFFQSLGPTQPEFHKPNGAELQPKPRQFHAFRREQWGIIHLRTDGQRLVLHARGALGAHETYVFRVDPAGNCKPAAHTVRSRKPVPF